MKSRFNKKTISIDYAERLNLSSQALPRGLYYIINSNNQSLPEFGWKIHISSVPLYAIETLQLVISLIKETNLEFKFIQNSELLQKTLHKSWPRENSGKFITIYPHSEEEFLQILNRLNSLKWPNLFPFILSDRQYKKSPIFYRYGRIKPKHGNKILGPNGSTFLDDPKPYFEMPNWIRDPAYTPTVETTNDFENGYLHGRYDVKEIVHVSNTGNIYLAIDTSDSSRVIIKETRPNMILVENYDELYFRNQEFNLIVELNSKILQSQIVPEEVEHFKIWQHSYHVFKYLENVPLYELTSDFKTLWHALTNTLKVAHNNDVAIGDVSPNNLVINNKAIYGISIIDLETGTSLQNINFASSMLRTKGYKLTAVDTTNDSIKLLNDMKLSDKEGLALTYIALIQPTGEIFDYANSNPEIGISLIRELFGVKIATEVSEYLRVSIDDEKNKIKSFVDAIINDDIVYDFNIDGTPKIDLNKQVDLMSTHNADENILREIFYRIAMAAVSDEGKYYIFATYGGDNIKIREFIEFIKKQILCGELRLW